jgi:glucose-6-phosphate isomerase
MNPFQQAAEQAPAAHWPEARKAAWQAALNLAQNNKDISQTLEDKARNAALTLTAAGLTLDCSRHWVTQADLDTLHTLLSASDFEATRTALFAGKPLNHTEQRAVLHMALRDLDGTNGTPPEARANVADCLERMRALANNIRSGDWQTSAQQAVTDVVNIGIGGSDLGPRMVTRALTPYCTGGPRLHFVANADPADLGSLLPQLNPATTLFIVCSKSFKTQETKCNAETARAWLQNNLTEPDLSRHFVGVTTNEVDAVAFGLAAENLLPLWDWVGGRYSVWSAIGLSVMIAIGPEAFDAFLRGAAEMDAHFRTAEATENAPVLMALLSILYCNGYHSQSLGIVPYATLLENFPSYLQQMVMESNGKSRLRNGDPTPFSTSPIIWGSIGTNSQHSFHQLLHQGTQLIPIDFIIALENHYGDAKAHNTLRAHCLAQMQALVQGQKPTPTEPDDHAALVAQHRYMSGNRPSSLITLPKLTPQHLGALIALYEHKTFVESCLWDINAYDQWGVELGKVLSAKLEGALIGEAIDTDALDPATKATLSRFTTDA